MSYTPGPWKIRALLPVDKTKRVAYVLTKAGGPLDGSPEGNAHLMSAAPDLLETCKWIRFEYLSHVNWTDSEAHKRLDAVIAKAEGRSSS